MRYGLATLPTPVHAFKPAGTPEGVDLWIKRDDLTGMQLSGNKVSLHPSEGTCNRQAADLRLPALSRMVWCK